MWAVYLMIMHVIKIPLKFCRGNRQHNALNIYLFIYLFILPHHKFNENSKRKNVKNGFNNGEET